MQLGKAVDVAGVWWMYFIKEEYFASFCNTVFGLEKWLLVHLVNDLKNLMKESDTKSYLVIRGVTKK